MVVPSRYSWSSVPVGSDKRQGSSEPAGWPRSTHRARCWRPPRTPCRRASSQSAVCCPTRSRGAGTPRRPQGRAVLQPRRPSTSAAIRGTRRTRASLGSAAGAIGAGSETGSVFFSAASRDPPHSPQKLADGSSAAPHEGQMSRAGSSTVSVAASASSVAPQLPQKRADGSSLWPHEGHVRSAPVSTGAAAASSSPAPQLPQNLAPASSGWPQLPQISVVVAMAVLDSRSLAS